MTSPTVIDTVLLTIQVGDGASSEAFAHPCLINLSRSITHTANATAVVIPQCNSLLPGETVRTVTSTDLTVQGAGKLDAATHKTYADWLNLGTSKNVKLQVGSATGSTIYTGPMKLLELSVTGQELGQPVEVSISLAQASKMTVTAHA